MLTGQSLIAGEPIDGGDGTVTARGGWRTFKKHRAHTSLPPPRRRWPRATRIATCPRTSAAFLGRIASAIESADELIDAAHAGTALPMQRLAGERNRTANQLRMFAALVREGSWVDARVDRALLPRPIVLHRYR